MALQARQSAQLHHFLPPIRSAGLDKTYEFGRPFI